MACFPRSEGVFYAYGCFQLSPLTWTSDAQDIQVSLLGDHLSILYCYHPALSDDGPRAHHDSQGHLNYHPSLVLNKCSASVGYDSEGLKAIETAIFVNKLLRLAMVYLQLSSTSLLGLGEKPLRRPLDKELIEDAKQGVLPVFPCEYFAHRHIFTCACPISGHQNSFSECLPSELGPPSASTEKENVWYVRLGTSFVSGPPGVQSLINPLRAYAPRFLVPARYETCC